MIENSSISWNQEASFMIFHYDGSGNHFRNIPFRIKNKTKLFTVRDFEEHFHVYLGSLHMFWKLDVHVSVHRSIIINDDQQDVTI